MRIYRMLLLFVGIAQLLAPLHAQPDLTGYSLFFLNESRPFFSEKGVWQQPLPAAMCTRYQVQGAADGQYVRAIVALRPDAELATWRARGVVLNPLAGKWRTATIPLSALYAVVRSPDFTQMDIDAPCAPQMDSSRVVTHANAVHAGGGALPQPYLGTGVLVGVVDRGFDWRHPAFYSPDGSRYRVQAVWDQGTDGTPPAGYDYGHLMNSEAQLLAAGTDDYDSDHGNHVAGLAAGSNFGSGKDGGMAPDADIALVASNFSTSGILDGIRFLMNLADERGQPLVVNLSVGGFMGHRDGTSAFDQAIDEMVGPGRVVVGAAGNQGHIPHHILHTFVGGDVVRTLLQLRDDPTETDEDGTGTLLAYSADATNFRMRFEVLDLSGNVLHTHSRLYSNFIADFTTGAIDTVSWAAGDTLIINADNPRNGAVHGTGWSYMGFMLTLRTETPVIVGTRLLSGAIGQGVHLWSGRGANGLPLSDSIPGSASPLDGYTAGDTDYTLTTIGGTGRSIISVGNNTLRTTYTTIQNETKDARPSPGFGHNTDNSSRGPTHDGRTKPELSAPGNIIVGPFKAVHNDPIDSTNIAYSFTHAGSEWYMGYMWGTSMASPTVAGAVALMLQARPDMEALTARSLLQEAAMVDEMTGAVPNNTYGYGKLNALEAVIRAQLTVNRDNLLQQARLAMVYPNPSTSAAQLRVLHCQAQPLQVRVMDMQGRVVWQHHSVPAHRDAQIALPHTLSGSCYLVQVAQRGWQQSLRWQKLD